MKKKLSAKMSVRLYTDDKCFGPGVAQLLTRVRELSSLRAAAMSMNMAYSKAWSIIKKCEAALGFKLLLSSTGGRNGGGAKLTPEAEKMLSAYNDYCRELEQYGSRIFKDKFADFINSSGEETENSEAQSEEN